jgi:hypothetical protein
MAIKRVAVLLLSIGGFLIACQSDEGASSDSQAPDEPNTCAAVGCGGDIVGRWDVTNTCLSPNDESLNWDLCPTARVRLSIKSSGTVSFDADGAFVIALTSEDTMRITIPSFCLTEAFDCSDFEQMFESEPDEPDLTCIHEDPNSPCICTGIILYDDGGLSGAYTTSEGMVTLYPGAVVEAEQSQEEQPQEEQPMGPSCKSSNERCDGNAECASGICVFAGGNELCAPSGTDCNPPCDEAQACVDVGGEIGLCLDHLDNPALEQCVLRENEPEDFEEESRPFSLEYCATDRALSLIIRGGYDPDFILSFQKPYQPDRPF